jgi:phosphonate transport system substrate-binding protein
MPVRVGLFAAVLLLAILLTDGCTRQKEEPPVRKIFGQQELLIGLIPEQKIFRQRERYNVLRNYLSSRLGIAVNFTSLSRYGNIVERFTAEKMDGAFFGSFTYGLAHWQLGVEPLARPVNLDGTSTYHGYLFARKDSGIRRSADMKGKRFAFVEHATTAGYLFPLAFFKASGVSDPEKYLGQSFFAGSHDAAILAVPNREADIGAAKNTFYDQLAAENPRVEQELIILSTSGVVPQNCLAVRKDLDPDLKQELKRLPVDMDKDPEGAEVLRKFGARGFVETTDRDYAYLYTLAAQVGIDLRTYSYRNK